MEKWTTIPFEPNYDISTHGCVRNKRTGKIKSLRYDHYVYLRVTLYPSGDVLDELSAENVGNISKNDNYQERFNDQCVGT